MAKSSLHHDRDGVALLALYKVLPIYWIYKDPANKLGGKEYSEDLIIEIVNDDARRTVSGIEFGVQNKTGVEIRKRHVTVRMAADDIERLMKLQRPVLIHGHDVKSETSYWLWLNEWYPENSAKLKRRKTVAVNIPKKNILDARAVGKIEQYARWEHDKQDRIKHADMVARQYKRDYAVYVTVSEMGVTTIFDPKHHDAIPTIQALDQRASDAMIQAYETGEIVPLVGSIAFGNVPVLMLESLHKDGWEIKSAWIIPHIPRDPISLIRIELLDEANNVISKSPVVEIHQTASGTIIQRFEGNDNEKGITYSFTFDGRANTTAYSIRFEPPISNAKDLRDYFIRLNRLRSVTKLRIENLKTEEIVERSDFELFKETDHGKLWERFALALVTIEEKLNLKLKLPKKLNGLLLSRAEWIAEILRDGSVKAKKLEFIPENGVLICSDHAPVVRRILADVEEHGQVAILAFRSDEDTRIKLLNQTINLGRVQYLFRNTKLINTDEVKTVLTHNRVSDNTSVQAIFEIDRNEVYLCFENWISQTLTK